MLHHLSFFSSPGGDPPDPPLHPPTVLKFIFDASKSTVPVLARYKLIADEYSFCPVWISGTKMIADVFSRLCIIPADKHSAMTNREIVMADINLLEADVEHRRRVRYDTVDFLFTNATSVDLNVISEGDDPTDLETPNEFNPDGQQTHEDEESLRGKLVVDVPPFTANELRTLRVCRHVRPYLTNGSITAQEDDPTFTKSVADMAKSCFLKDDHSL